jgi:hypothetical protein
VAAHLLCGFDHLRKFHVRCGIEIEHQTARHVIQIGRAIPGMQLEPADLRHRGQSLDLVDLQIGFAVAGHPRKRQELRGALHAVTLEEMLAMDAVGCAHDRTRPALDVRHHPLADRLEIVREIELGDGLTVAGIRPHRLVGIGDGHPHHLGR